MKDSRENTNSYVQELLDLYFHKIKIFCLGDFPGGPVAKTLQSQRKGPGSGIPGQGSLVRDLDPTNCN